MQVMARMAKRRRKRVRPKIRKSLRRLRPSRKPESRAARKQAVPVAVSQLKSNLAASAVGLATTGGGAEDGVVEIGNLPAAGTRRPEWWLGPWRS